MQPLSNVSIVHWFPDLERHKCGYCKSRTGSTSYGMWAECLTVEDYQALVDRGWRRSGNYCYKPILNRTCCPQYTIRCDIKNFKISKSQKKVVKRSNKYQEDGILPKCNPFENQEDAAEGANDILIKERPTGVDVTDLPERLVEGANDVPLVKENEDKIVRGVEDKQNVSRRNSSFDKTYKLGLGADPNKPPCKKAKLLRLERKQQKMDKAGMTIDKTQKSEAKSLTDLLAEVPKVAKHKLQIRLIPTTEPNLNWESTKQLEFDLYKKYQMVIHNDPPDKCTVKGFTRFLVSSPLKIKLVQMDPTHVLFQLTVQLYTKYQMFVHNESKDECGQEAFTDFLVKSPLEPVQKGPVKYGSFHQQYWLGDKLIAVGVIDILPKCVSSVYFFYDPDYRSLTLGTYGALREIDYTTSLNRLCPSILYYYMGFYIHSCQKMRYKGKFSPSDLLCPETYEWFPIEKCLLKLDISKYSRLNDDLAAEDANACMDDDIKGINIILNGQFCKYRYYKYRQKYADVFTNIGTLVGKKCAKTILVVSPHRN